MWVTAGWALVDGVAVSCFSAGASHSDLFAAEALSYRQYPYGYLVLTYVRSGTHNTYTATLFQTLKKS